MLILGDVDPCRDLTIISDELRIKDIEFVEKHLELLKKVTNRGGQSLEVKAKKEEEVIVQKILKHLQDEKDVRKGDWNNKEVVFPALLNHIPFMMTKSLRLYNPSSSSSLSYEIFIL